MFEIQFDRPIECAVIKQLNEELIEADFFAAGDLQYTRIIPIYSRYNSQPEDPEVVFAREQWNNLL